MWHIHIWQLLYVANIYMWHIHIWQLLMWHIYMCGKICLSGRYMSGEYICIYVYMYICKYMGQNICGKYIRMWQTLIYVYIYPYLPRFVSVTWIYLPHASLPHIHICTYVFATYNIYIHIYIYSHIYIFATYVSAT